MALKDWKKLGKDKWKNKLTDMILLVYKSRLVDRKYFNKWTVDNYRDLDKSFKIKLQALKFAKSYMRKH